MTLIWLGILLLLASSLPSEARRKFNRGRKNVCEKIAVPECANLGYKWTKFPNPFTKISSQAETNNLTRFLPVLAQLNCTENGATPIRFLCSVYVPACIAGSEKPIIPPCREFCQSSVGSCPALAATHGIQWPSTLDCSNYPSKSDGVKCINSQRFRNKNRNNGNRKPKAGNTTCCRLGQFAAMKNKACNLTDPIKSPMKKRLLKGLKMCKDFESTYQECCSNRLAKIEERLAKKLERKNKKAEKKLKKEQKQERKKQKKADKKQEKERKQQKKAERKQKKDQKRKEKNQGQKKKDRKLKKQNRKNKKNGKSG